jgi:hypothetical protein
MSNQFESEYRSSRIKPNKRSDSNIRRKNTIIKKQANEEGTKSSKLFRTVIKSQESKKTSPDNDYLSNYVSALSPIGR